MAKKSHLLLMLPLIIGAVTLGACSVVEDDTEPPKIETKEDGSTLIEPPSDVPIYKNAKIETSSSTLSEIDGTDTSGFTFAASDSFIEVTKYYEQELKKLGWSDTDALTVTEEQISTIAATKDDRDLAVTIKGGVASGATITIVVSN